MDALINRREVVPVGKTIIILYSSEFYLPSIANDDLRRVFVRHDHCRRGQSIAVCVRVVSLKRFLYHPNVMIVSHLEVVAEE